MRAREAHSYRERNRMVVKHYGSWLEYQHRQILHDRGQGPAPKSPEAYLREENPYSGF